MKPCRVVTLICWLCISSSAFSQWQVISTGYNTNMMDGVFLNDSVGFVISYDGKIFKTNDYGSAWMETADLDGVFTSICNGGFDTLYAGGGKLYRSVDGGGTWTMIHEFSDNITQIGFFGSAKGYVIVPGSYTCTWAGETFTMDGYEMYQSMDQGSTWTPHLAVADSKSMFQLVNNAVGYVTAHGYTGYPHCYDGGQDRSQKTMNGGTTWNYFYQPLFSGTHFHFYSADSGYFFRPWRGNNPEDKYKLWSTTNGCATYNQLYTEIPDQSADKCLFINEVQGFLLGASKVYFTNSEGLLWEEEYSSSNHLNQLIQAPSRYVFGLGNDGLIIRREIIPNTTVHNVYRMTIDPQYLNFGYTPVNTAKVQSISLTNTGNVNFTASVDAPTPFRVGLTPTSFSDHLDIPLTPFQSLTLYVQFDPLLPQTYNKQISIQNDSAALVNLQVSGIGYAVLSGQITSDTLVCGDTIRVASNIVVQVGATLTICPGTKLLFLNENRLEVKGQLMAMGIDGASIDFIQPRGMGKWAGIILNNPDTSQTSILNFCNAIDSCSGSVIHVVNGRLQMDGCQIMNGEVGGILVSGPRSILTVSRTQILNNYGPGIDCEACNRMDIKANSQLNEFGIVCMNSVNSSLITGWIIGNHRDGIYGNGNIEVSDCHIFENGGRGLLLFGKYGKIQSNMICYNDSAGVEVMQCDSVYVFQDNSVYFNENGGGLRLSGNEFILENNRIYQNNDQGIFLNMGDKGCSITQNLIFGNKITYAQFDKGAGIHLTTQSSVNPIANIISNTICNNSYITFGNDVYGFGYDSAAMKVNFFNNIVYNELISNFNVIWWPGVDATMNFNCINQTGIEGLGNINEDPRFIYKEIKDYRLSDSSHCINAGDTLNLLLQLPVDMDSNVRIYGGRIDMGCYESQIPMGIKKNVDMEEITIYPNPSNGTFRVRSTWKNLKTITVYDINGIVILERSFEEEAMLSLKSHTKGNYLYEVRRKGTLIKSGKLVVN